MFSIENPADICRFMLCITAIAVITTVGTNFWLLDPGTFESTRYVSLLVAVMISLPVSLLVGTKLLEIHRLNKRLKFLLGHDQLTKAMTREGFFSIFGENDRTAGTALMIDIDHFKSVNDTHGHLVGDEVLKHVSSILTGACRGADRVCRFGGEEFIIFIDKATQDEGFLIADRIRNTVELCPIIVGDISVNVTISVGVAHKSETNTIYNVLKVADEALYNAKNAGRNMVRHAENTGAEAA